MIHPTAIVDPSAYVGADVTIGAYAMVEGRVAIGDGCVLRNHAVLRAGTVLGERVVVDSFAVIGGLPQSLTFDETIESGVTVGARTVMREAATVSRSTKPGGFTVIGERCFIMGSAHVGHDCRIGDDVVLGHACLLAGHVDIDDRAFIGGGAAAHQFCRIGASVMVGGATSVVLDVPPFALIASRRGISGLNLVGLRRQGIARKSIAELKDLFSQVYAAGNPRATAAQLLEREPPQSLECLQFLRFFAGSTRGVARLRRHARDDER